MRIGFRPTESAPLLLLLGGERMQRLVLSGAAISLDTVRIADRRSEMESKLSDVAAGSVSVRATTTDRLGFTGRNEGLVAQAVALLAQR